MSDQDLMNRIVSSIGIGTGIGCVIELGVLALKLTHVVHMGWGVALAPILVTFGLAFTVAVALGIIVYFKTK